MTHCDSDGAEFLTQLGGDAPPVYPGTAEPVITPRLRGHLSPVEISWWSGNPLVRYLGQRAFWLTGGDPIDGWDVEDFVAYVLERSVKHGTGNRSALSTWLQQGISRRRAEAARLETDPLYVEDEDGEEYSVINPEGRDFVPVTLPDEVLLWLESRVSPRMYRALRFVAEEGYSQEEAAHSVGLTQQAVSKALRGLRDSLEEIK